jgi:2-iminoacetate synthase
MYFLARHLKYLINKYWKINFAVSFPRILNENIDFEVPHKVGEYDFVKIIASMRLLFPDTPIYLSTREKPYLRDNVVKYGITHMSVESKTEPGGYTLSDCAQNQFSVEDTRSVEEIIGVLDKNGLRPVFKDWDRGYRIKEV